MAATNDRHAARVTFQNVRDPSADLAQTVAVSGRGSYGVQIVLICWVTTAGRSRLSEK
jgi:hypothetical protein